MNLLLAFILIVLEAVFEGLKTGGLYLYSEAVEFIYLILVTLMVFAWLNRRFVFNQPKIGMFIKVLIGYILLRFSLFDFIWNISAGQPLDYIGNTKLFDGALQFLKDMWGFSIIVLIKSISGFWGISWLTKWGNKTE